MGGGQRSQSSMEWTPEQRQLQSLQAQTASSVQPGLQQFILSVLGGEPRTSGYARSAMGPIESATQRSISGILARMPRGGMQHQLVEQARQQGALQEANVEQEYIRQALAMAASLFNYRPQAEGQTTTQSGGPKFGVSLPFFSTTF